MADTAKFRSDIDEQYRRPAWSPAMPAMRTPAQAPEYTAQGVGEALGGVARSGVEGAAGIAVRGAQQIAGVAVPAVGGMYQAATYVPRTMLRGAADFGAGVLRGAGVLPEEAAAAPAGAPAPVRPAAMLPLEPGPVRPAATLPMEPGPGSGTGFRIIRREGEAPILTNVDNPYAAISQGRNFIQTDEGRTDFLGGVPQGFRLGAQTQAASTPPQESPAAQAAMRQLATEQNPFTAGRLREIVREDAATRTPAVEQGFRPARSGQRVYAPTYNAVFGSVAQQRAAYDANLLGQQNADTARMTAETGRVNALAALQKALNEQGVGKLEITPPRPDVNALPDAKTGKYPMLPGSVKIGKTEVPLAAEDADNAQTLAQRHIAEYRRAYPDATETPETLFNRFYKQAIMEIIDTKVGGAQ